MNRSNLKKTNSSILIGINYFETKTFRTSKHWYVSLLFLVKISQGKEDKTIQISIMIKDLRQRITDSIN